jgi:hypothetical protein
MGLARFCREAGRVRAGPLLDAWKVVMVEMRHGEPEEILQAMKYLRVRGAQDMNHMFIDHTRHHDSEEWVATFLATAKIQIEELQRNLRIVEPMTFIDRQFEYSLKNVINCSL